MTVNRKFFLIALGALAVAGCSAPPATPDTPLKQDSTSGTATPPTSEPGGEKPAVTPPDGKAATPGPDASGATPPEKTEPGKTTPGATKPDPTLPKGPLPSKTTTKIVPGKPMEDKSVQVTQAFKKIAMTPEELAKKVESRFYSLENTECGAAVEASVPSGQGSLTTFLQVDNHGKFRASYYTFPKGTTATEIVIVNGGKSGYLPFAKEAAWQVTSAIGAKPFATPPNGILKGWKDNFQHLMFGAVMGLKPFSNFVAAAKKPGSGYSVSVLERIAVVQNHRFRTLRMKVAQPAKGSVPGNEILMDFDGDIFLPTTIVVNVKDGKDAYKITWNGRWERKKAPYAASLFVIPKQGQVAGT